MRRFGTQGRVRPEQDYIVSRPEEITDFINRIKEGRYIVLFAPRQTGKTTFCRLALDVLATEDPTYFPIQLDFQTMRSEAAADGYYVIFDNRQNPEPRKETEQMKDVKIRSYVIPVVRRLSAAV